jgi:hypothetical protein
MILHSKPYLSLQPLHFFPAKKERPVELGPYKSYSWVPLKAKLLFNTIVWRRRERTYDRLSRVCYSIESNRVYVSTPRGKNKP